MYQVFKINEERLPAAAGRTIRSVLKIMIAVYLLMNIYMLLWLKFSFRDIIPGALVCIPAFGLSLWLGYALLKQRFRRYRIVVDDEGVKYYMPPNDKKIKWQDLKFHSNPDGTLDLRDRTRSATARWLTGEGQITVFPEIDRFDQLRQEIGKQSEMESQ